MSAAVANLVKGLDSLSAAERMEFLSLVAIPRSAQTEDWTDDDFVLTAGQTFARLDEEEEANGRADS
jgi:hypothetical protein